MRTTTCSACGGTGHMSDERAAELSTAYRQPICTTYGCENCDGLGEIPVDEDDEEL